MIQQKKYKAIGFIKTIIALVFIMGYILPSRAQVVKQFTPRASSNATAPYTNVSNYYLQGDFAMVGNTNMTLATYGNSSNNSNISMVYVDIDGDPNTINSSYADLTLPGGECTEIVYAGLYWTGRTNNEGSSPETFTIASSTNDRYNTDSFDGYTLTISASNNNYYSSEGRLATYTFSPNSGGNAIVFRFYSGNTNQGRVTVQVGSGQETDLQGSVTNNSNNNFTFTLSSPYQINSGTPIQINSLRKRRTNNSIDDNYRASVSVAAKNLNKRFVQLKKNGESYQSIEAATSSILYPSNQYDNIYAAYADVTNYVRSKGDGRYYVADIATQSGNGGSVGYFGGWGMVVIYKNTSLKWRDITIFDGYAYMSGDVGAATLGVSGFKATQNGDVNVTMGMMAAEGDVGISGDYFQMRHSGTTSTYTSLSHSGNTTNNFFNSSIFTGGNTRSPNLTNNTGVDISRFNLPNSTKTFIKNGDTNTQFRYGTATSGNDRDTYVIYNIVFAVDAYVPEVVGENSPGTNNPGTGNTVDPGQGLEFDLNLYNKGTEAVNNLVVDIPIPFNLHYDGSTIVPGTHATVKIPNNTYVEWIKPSWAPVGATPQVYPGGTLRWTVGNLPLDPNRDILQGTLKYKFKVTSNCALLSTAGPCGLKINVNGTISGVGATSGVAVSARLVRDYAAGNCSGAIYDDFESTIAVSQAFIQNCAPPPVENDMLQFKAFCSLPGNAFPRADIAGKYPLGTKFFTTVPTSYDQTTNIVTGDFQVNTDGTKRTFYAVVPGMDAGCYIRLQTSLTLVTTQPTVQNVSACQGTPVVLQNALSPTGVSNGYQLYYFNSASATVPLSSAPNPTAVGTHNFWVAEGTSVSGTLCIGPKVPFTVTINSQPVVQQNVGNISICENNDAQITVNVSDVTTYTWQYATAAAPTVWNSLSNTTYSGQITVNNSVLNISHATPALNGIKVRLRATNSNNCENLSNQVSIEIKNCGAITNPMLPNKAGKQ